MGDAMPELPSIPSIVMRSLPEFVLCVLFIYALIALLLTTLFMIARIVKARSNLPDVSTREELLAVFARSGLQRWAARVFDLAPLEVPGTRRKIVLQSPFSFGRARQEFAQLYRRRLARSQFFTVLAVLVAIAGLSWLQDDARISILGTVFPLWQALVAIVALALLSILGRLAIHAATESLLDKISELPKERIELTFMRNMTGALERLTASFPDSVQRPFGDVEPILERLTRTVEAERGSLVEPIQQLSASAERLTAIATTISERPTDGIQQASYTGIAEELKTALERLTARIDWLSGLLAHGGNAPTPNGSDSHSREPARAKTDIHQELHALLKDFE
jgi:hypothetical protein